MNLNQIGSLLLLLSAASILFAIFMALLGMSLRQSRSLFRSIALETIDQFRKAGPSFSKPFYRRIIGVWVPIQRKIASLLGLRSLSVAIDLSKQAIYVNAALVCLALFTLMCLMLAGDLTNRYVVSHSSADLALFFKVTGTWAGSSGSLLFWYCLLTLFSSAVVYQSATLRNRIPFLLLTLGVVQFVFVLLALFYRDAQPFRVFPQSMKAGQGLNPLLQHWGMIIHPPILYTGYVSSAMPFAIAASALISGNLKDSFYPLLRRWTIFSWFFLGTGILLGSKWAYEELGWGGYWAWDPVENASLMPFLLMTAFLHTIIVSERRGMLRFWTMLLVLLAYHFSMLGTWITRSGVLQGPHSFSESTIGTPLIIYIGGSFFFFLRFIILQRKRLKPDEPMDTITSKEGTMVLNNFLMILSVAVILVGVFSPLLKIDCIWDAGLVCRQTEWKLTAYNRIMVPVGIFALFLMGASPLLAWKKGADEVYGKNLRLPLIVGLITGIIFGVSYRYLFSVPGEDSSWGSGIVAEVFTVLTVAIAGFISAGVIQEFARGIRSRRIRLGENPVQALIRLVLRNKRRYGGYLVHISVMFLFIGYAGGSFKKTAKLDFHYYRMPQYPGSSEIHYYSGDKGYVEDYEVEATDLFFSPGFRENADKNNPLHLVVAHEGYYKIRRSGEPNKPLIKREDLSPHANALVPFEGSASLVRILTGLAPGGWMKTERQFHPQIYPVTGEIMRSEDGRAQRTPTSKPDIRSSFDEDIYIQIGSILDPNRQRNPDFTHLYEMYYFEFQKRPEAYEGLFPQTIVATLEIWVNPMVKFVWFGSILFFLSGLILLLPFGERR